MLTIDCKEVTLYLQRNSIIQEQKMGRWLRRSGEKKSGAVDLFIGRELGLVC